jgi:SAM-dependent methyltransferase
MSKTETKVFSEYAHYYDLLYRDKDYAGEAEYIDNLIRRFQPEANSILELGSGTGKHALLLAQKGFRVHGLERSEQMLASARQLLAQEKARGLDFPPPVFTQGDIRSTRLDHTFDAATALFHVISYQTSNDDLLAAFRNARAHLLRGGLFVFDVWYGPAVLTERPTVRVKRMADERIEVTRLAEPVIHPNDNIVEVNYHVFIRDRKTGRVSETRETHLMRYLFQPELAIFAKLSQFRLEHGEEWLTGHAPDFRTWGVCFVFRAE